MSTLHELGIWHHTRLRPGDVGGVEKHIHFTAAEFVRRGAQVHVGLTPPAIERARWIVHTHGDTPAAPGLREWVSARAGARWIQMAHGTSAGRLVACREYWSRSVWRGVLRDRALLRAADFGIFVSARALAEARLYFGYRGPGPVVSNGADPATFQPLERLTPSPRIVFLGRMGDRVKNLERLLEASARVARAVPNFRLVLAPGFRPDESAPPFVESLGATFGSDLAKLLATSRALVLCSYYEGNPLVFHEARAMGLPLVLSDIPALREAAGADAAGVAWASPRDVDSIERALISALRTRDPIRPIVRSWSQVVDELAAVYGSSAFLKR